MRRSRSIAAVVSGLTAGALLMTAPGATAATPRTDGAAGAPTSIRPDPGTMPSKLSAAERAGLLKAARDAAPATARKLGLGGKEKLIVRDVVKDGNGAVHTRYDRSYDGLPVIGGDLIVHQKRAGGPITSTTKATSKKITVAGTTPAQAKAAAQKGALAAATQQQGLSKTAGARTLAAKDGAKGDNAVRGATVKSAPKLVVWAAKGTPRLAWQTVIGGTLKDGTPSRRSITTDAGTGKVLSEDEAVKGGSGTGQWNGKVTIGTSGTAPNFTMTDPTRGGHKTYDLNQGSSGTGTLYTDADDIWGDGTNTNRQTAGVDAAFGAQATWDYYKNVFGRNGIKNDGVGAYSRVHYGNKYINAFWDDDCFCMTYGDGEGNAKPLTSIDVAAHEMSHGVTSATANLIYDKQSGGLNEGTSDIFAAAVEFQANTPGDTPDYLVGEKIDIFGDGSPLRYMDQPSKDGSSLDYYYDDIDSVDVHYSSGPANHFFYMLAEGSGAKTINGVKYYTPTYDGRKLGGIGRYNAERIWYKALTTYMTSTTDFEGARVATLKAARALYGNDRLILKAVNSTWAALNVQDPADPIDDWGKSYTNDTDVAIPDATTTATGKAESAIDVLRNDAPKGAVRVNVDITHTYRGDIMLELVAPSGKKYWVKNPDGFDSGANVNVEFPITINKGEKMKGTWKLSIQDVYRGDTGKLNGWKLTI